MTLSTQENQEFLKKSFQQRVTAKSPVMRIVLTLMHAIEDGYFSEEDKLPSIRRLSALFQVSKNSVSEALDVLSNKGLIRIEPNRGVFVDKKRHIKGRAWDNLLGLSYQLASPIHRHESLRESGLLSGPVNLSKRMDESWDDNAGIKFVSPYVKKALSDAQRGFFEDLYNEQGLPILRQFLAEWMSNQGIETNPNQILVLSHRVQAYKLLSDLLFSPQVTLGIQKENFFNAYPSGMSKAFRRVYLDVDEEGLIIDKLLFSKGKRILFIQPTRNEPTGTMTFQERREQIYQDCVKEGIPILEESIAAPFYRGRRKVKPIKCLDREGLVIYIGGIRDSLTPSLSLCWIVAPENIISSLLSNVRKDIFFASEFNQMVLTEILKADALDDFYQKEGAIFDRRYPLYANLVDKYFQGVASYAEHQVWGRIWLRFNKPIKVSTLYSARKDVDFQPGIIYGDSTDSTAMLYLFCDIITFEEGLKRLRQLVYDVYQL